MCNHDIYIYIYFITQPHLRQLVTGNVKSTFDGKQFYKKTANAKLNYWPLELDDMVANSFFLCQLSIYFM